MTTPTIANKLDSTRLKIKIIGKIAKTTRTKGVFIKAPIRTNNPKTKIRDKASEPVKFEVLADTN